MLDDKRFKVYKHTNIYNGKVYIGITSLPLLERWSNGKGYRGCKLFYRAILKYGWDSFYHNIICNDLPKSVACLVEKRLIAYYKSKNLSYNITDGGEGTLGRKVSEEYKEVLRQRMLGDENPTKGRKMTKEQINKLRSAHSNPISLYTLDGLFIANYESCKDAERKLGISSVNILQCIKTEKNVNSARGFIFIKLGNYRALYKKVQANKSKYNKPWKVLLYLNGELIATYESVRKASLATGIDNRSIAKNINGLYKHAGGYIWKKIL